MSDYAVKVTVRNGRILRMMRERGIESVAQLARIAGCPYQTAVQIISLRKAPEKKNGQWTETVLRIAGAFGCDPEELFSDAQRTLEIPTNSREVYIDEPQMAALSSGDMEQSSWARIEAQRLLAGIPARERGVVEAIIEGATLEEVGKELGVHRERVRQLYAKGLRRMKGAAYRDEGEFRNQIVYGAKQ